MNGTEKQEYGNDTHLMVRYPWGGFHGGRALCADGKVRALKRISTTADTFYSVPASVAVNGKTVSGYVTVQTMRGFSTATDDDPAVVKFYAYEYGANGHLLRDEVAARGTGTDGTTGTGEAT